VHTKYEEMYMTIQLVDISQANFIKCISLEVNENEKCFISSNVKSLAESKYWPFWIPKIILIDDIMVGFLMYAKDYEDGKLDICRLMIDKKYQGKGYGISTLKIMKDIGESDKGIDRIVVHVVKENTKAKSMYLKFGFEDKNFVEYEQDVFELRLRKKQRNLA
jgi:diamine N-acetyltransferase